MSARRQGRRGRGGQAGHEPRARIRTRERRALELSVLGWSQLQIAADLGVTQAATSKLLKRIEARLLHDMSETVQRQKARQMLRLERLFAEAMQAWTESKADTTRRRQRQAHGAEGAGGTFAELVVENQHGDPRYLDEARKILADERKLWGLDAPQRLDVHAVRGRYDDMTEEALRAELARQTRLLGGTATASDVTTTAVVPDPGVDARAGTPGTSRSSEEDATHGHDE